jgi:hypothetical protein
MTDPDNHRNHNRSRSQTPPQNSPATPEEGFPQPNFFSPAAQAALGQHGNVDIGIDNDDPFLIGNSTGSRVVHAGPPVINMPPEVILPPGWDAPLRHPIPVNIPAAPVLPHRGRGQGQGQGQGQGHGHGRVLPMYAINSNFSNPAVDGLHRGQIALRERELNFRNHAAEQSAVRQAELDALNAYRNEQIAQHEALRQQQIHQAQANAQAQELLRQQQQNHIRQQELLTQQQNIHHQAQQQIAQINLQEIRAEREQRDAEAIARFHQLYRERQQRDAEEEERLAEERFQENRHLSQIRRTERHLQIRNLSTSGQNDTLLDALMREDRHERERDSQETARRQFEHEAAEFEIRRNAENFHRRQQVINDQDLDPLPPQPRGQGLPIGCRLYSDPSDRHSLGPMNIHCSHCHALHFDSEKLTSSTRNNKKFGGCCLQGQVKLPAFPDPPVTLRNLLCGVSPQSKTFKKEIRQYNAAFAFTSLGVKIDSSVTGAHGGPFSFRINGELHHKMGSLLPENNDVPRYAQLYVHGGFEQSIANRLRNNPNLDVTIMTQLQAMLHQTHPYVALFKHAYQIMADLPQEEQGNVQVRLHVEQSADQRRYNLPSVDEIAAIVPGDGSENVKSDRDIVVRLIGGGLQRISHLHPSYSSLHYVLLFPHGEDGWSNAIPTQRGASGNVRSATVSQRCYYAYRLHARPGEQPLLLHGGNLLQ